MDEKEYCQRRCYKKKKKLFHLLLMRSIKIDINRTVLLIITSHQTLLYLQV